MAANKSDRPSQCLRAEHALDELCSIYRSPIVEFCRSQLNRRDAEDIAQSFLIEIAHGRFLSRAEKHKGKFRNLVLASLKHFVFDLLDREKAAKRGGNIQFETLPDDLGKGGSLTAERGMSADVLFDIAWANALAHQALDQLQKTYSMRKQRDAFDCLHPFLTSKASGDEAARAASALETSVAGFHVRVHRFCKEYGKILRQEVAKTVGAPHEIESELRYLIDLLAQSKWSS